MIHYHGTPLGGKKADTIKFIAGRHVLVPWTYQSDLAVVREFASSFVLDNGAFTHWRKGTSPKCWSEYYDWVAENMTYPNFDWALIPDVIDGDEEQNDLLLASWPSELLCVGVPVFHFHESMDRLGRLARDYHRIALGSSGQYAKPGSSSWWSRMEEIMSVLCNKEGRPICKIHGLRMLDQKIVSMVPLSSADSTNAAQNGNRKGKQMNCSTIMGKLTIATRIESVLPPSSWEPSQNQECLFV